MSLLVVSGMPSQKKKHLFLFLLDKLSALSGSTVVLVQNSIGVCGKEEASRLKAAVQHNLSRGALVCVYAPLHMKSLRYEILSSIARNAEQGIAHIYCDGAYSTEGEIKEEEILSIEKAAFFAEIDTAEKKESLDVVQKVFEAPSSNSKWDRPCFVYSSSETIENVLEEVVLSLAKEKKKRVSSKKIIPQPADQKYLEKVKSEIDKVFSEYKKREFISLRNTRQVESEFLRSIQTRPPPIQDIQSVFRGYLEEYLKGE